MECLLCHFYSLVREKHQTPTHFLLLLLQQKKNQKSNDKGWWFIGSGFWYMIRFIFINFVEVFKFVLTLCFLRDTKSDLSSESVDEIQPKKVIHRIINFDDVKLVKNIMQMKRILLYSLEAFNFYGIIKLTMKFFGEKVVQAISKRLFDHTTLTYLNVMGPDKEISIFDQPISYLAASALTGSQVLNIHFVSYVNKLTISLAVDATVIPDPHRLCDDLVESLNIIKSTALEKFRIS
ncbi:unnamed protein product [Brassica oleracea]